MFVLATGHQGTIQTLLKNLVICLSELVLAADKILIVGDFNIHIDIHRHSELYQG